MMSVYREMSGPDKVSCCCIKRCEVSVRWLEAAPDLLLEKLFEEVVSSNDVCRPGWSPRAGE